MLSVLFICTANICRSPMAEGLLKIKVAQEAQQWRIESAGVWALAGHPAASYTRQVLQQRGIDLSNFRARQVTRQMLADFNLVLTMERGHKEALRAAFPEFSSKIFLISELLGRKSDIVDPMGSPLGDFEDTALELDYILSTAYEHLRRLATDTPALGSRQGIKSSI